MVNIARGEEGGIRQERRTATVLTGHHLIGAWPCRRLSIPHPVLVYVGKRVRPAHRAGAGVEGLGMLAVGKKSQLAPPGVFEHAVLLQNGGIAQSTLTAALTSAVERELAGRLRRETGGVRSSRSAKNRAWSFEWSGRGSNPTSSCSVSHRSAMPYGDSRGVCRRAFVVTGIASARMALLLALLASRAISEPLADLAADLEKSAETGDLWSQSPSTR
jgi:hypothetical protein